MENTKIIMKTIKTLPNQTIYDIAIIYYGTAEAVSELLMNNPNLTNDPVALSQENTTNKNGFYVDIALAEKQSILIDPQSSLVNRNIVKELHNEITTYGTQD